MKNRKWPYIVLIVLCVLVFWAYRKIDKMRTDTVAPVIQMEETLLYASAQEGDEALLAGVKAEDDVDGDVTDSLVVENVTLINSDGMVSVVYAAFDGSGNVAKAERQVQYTDYESPRFGLDAPLMFQENSGFDVLGIITARDMMDGDISHCIRATSLDENSIATVGTHQIRFRVTNSLGDSVNLELPVEVYSAGTYQGYLELSDYLVYLDAGAVFDAKDYPVQYTLNGTEYPVASWLTGDFYMEIIDDVDTSVPGVYVVTYILQYVKNETVYTGSSKLIVVVEG